MLSRFAQESMVFGRDDGVELFRFATDEFAAIAFVSADDERSAAIVTAAKRPEDRADVRGGNRGNYRAFRVDASGVRALTDEYTNTAIVVSGTDAIAYGNGSGLVVLDAATRRHFRTGNFNWGPTSVSCNADGTRVGMTKWKGDSRHLFSVDLGANDSHLSKFSYYSYLWHREHVYYELNRAIKTFHPETQETKTVSDRHFSQRLLTLLGVAKKTAEVDIDFGKLTTMRDRLIAVVSVYTITPDGYTSFAYAVVSFAADGSNLALVATVPERWRVDALSALDDVLIAHLIRHEDFKVVERKSVAIAGRSDLFDAGWWPVPRPHIPEAGFQFLPQSPRA